MWRFAEFLAGTIAVASLLVVSLLAIETDGSNEEKPRFRITFGRLFNDLGLATHADWQSRQRQGKQLAEDVFGVTDDIIATNPDIND